MNGLDWNSLSIYNAPLFMCMRLCSCIESIHICIFHPTQGVVFPFFAPEAITTDQNRGWIWSLSPGYREVLSEWTIPVLTTGAAICVCVYSGQSGDPVLVSGWFWNLRNELLIGLWNFKLHWWPCPVRDSWKHLLHSGQTWVMHHLGKLF